MLKQDSNVLTIAYDNIRSQSESICAALETEDYVVQPAPEVSPPKWHLAHTTWFFENFILKKYLKNYQPFNPIFDLLFNSYYKSCGKHWLQQNRGMLSRPTVSAVYAYRQYVDKHIALLLNDSVFHIKDLVHIMNVGLQHEQQHQELLLMDIKLILSTNPEYPAYIKSPHSIAETHEDKWFSFDEGLYPIGNNGQQFCYDNEQPKHQTYIHPFKISNNLVTNGMYLEFINDGAYTNPLLWLSDGWNWVNANKIDAPLYWKKKHKEWHEYTLYGLDCLQLNAPVSHISFYEADAFARWYGARLASEHEFEICYTQSIASGRRIMHPHSTRVQDQQLWAWTSSEYTAYPGYQAFSGALGEYNAKFMCNQKVLRGGSFATPADHYRPTYRNFYLPSQRWMFSGICLAQSLPYGRQT